MTHPDRIAFNQQLPKFEIIIDGESIGFANIEAVEMLRNIPPVKLRGHSLPENSKPAEITITDVVSNDRWLELQEWCATKSAEAMGGRRIKKVQASCTWKGKRVDFEADTPEELGEKIGQWMESVGIDRESVYPIRQQVNIEGEGIEVKEMAITYEKLNVDASTSEE